MNECIKMMWYIQNGILFSYEKERYTPICSNMDGLQAHYAKQDMSDRQTDKYCMIPHSYMESKKVKLVKIKE